MVAAVNIVGAEKKLRQALFFLAHLQQAPREIRRGSANPEHQNTEQLEFYFSACLSAAKSVYYVLDTTGGTTFKDIERRWRAKLAEVERSRFGRMMGLRDDDVHLASTPAKPLPKYEVEDHRWNSNPYYHEFYNAALFGPRPVIEEENPDGTKVTGSVLRGTVGLYIEQPGRRVEAADACREFIQQLRSLLDEIKASLDPKK